jgi:hypothetical protein
MKGVELSETLGLAVSGPADMVLDVLVLRHGRTMGADR